MELARVARCLRLPFFPFLAEAILVAWCGRSPAFSSYRQRSRTFHRGQEGGFKNATHLCPVLHDRMGRRNLDDQIQKFRDHDDREHHVDGLRCHRQPFQGRGLLCVHHYVLRRWIGRFQEVGFESEEQELDIRVRPFRPRIIRLG